MQEILYEGDQISLFGLITYDCNTGQASIDKAVSMMLTNAKEAIVSKLKWENIWLYAKSLLIGVFGLFLLSGFALSVSLLRQRLREIRLKDDTSQLAEEDTKNKIPGAPPKYRSLPKAIKGPILLDDLICSKCRRNKSNIVFLPCKCCLLCADCYKVAENKALCSKCK